MRRWLQQYRHPLVNNYRHYEQLSQNITDAADVASFVDVLHKHVSTQK